MPKNKGDSQTLIDIFISHSSADLEVAASLIELLRIACNVPQNRIRCTSVDGYRLPAGASTDTQLRMEVHDAKTFIGLITPASIQSTYVLFELGARWGAGRHLAPILARGADASFLRGPLYGINALNCSSPAQVHQLIDDICSTLGTSLNNTASYQGYVDKLVNASCQTLEHQAATSNTIHHQSSSTQDLSPNIRNDESRVFGQTWGKMRLPLRARVGIIDPSDEFEIGLSAMQLDNIGHTGKYNGVIVGFLERKTKAKSYNAFGMMAMEGSEIRLSSALADYLSCVVGEEISIEGLAVLQ